MKRECGALGNNRRKPKLSMVEFVLMPLCPPQIPQEGKI